MAHKSDLIAGDIEQYLHAHQHKGLLRFITCGSVDDGKSTLIGRLLYESKLIFEDQRHEDIPHIKAPTAKHAPHAHRTQRRQKFHTQFDHRVHRATIRALTAAAQPLP